MADFKFRTIIEQPKAKALISHESKLLMLGSCFTDNVGRRLTAHGFNVTVNPMGILFNPASIASILNRALSSQLYTASDLVNDNGVFHCLDFESRRQSADSAELLESLNRDFTEFSALMTESDTWIITFGTAWIFERRDNGMLVGNCHKFNPTFFNRRRLSVDEITRLWRPLCQSHRVIFTVSPIRHLADGLHGNNISKSTLLLAIEALVDEGLAEYFPAYEILVDDLRDYRFYDADMKHPSEVACDYIFDIFSKTYFDKNTQALALENLRAYKAQKHRQIL
jgi:hypothetical protein